MSLLKLSTLLKEKFINIFVHLDNTLHSEIQWYIKINKTRCIKYFKNQEKELQF